MLLGMGDNMGTINTMMIDNMRVRGRGKSILWWKNGKLISINIFTCVRRGSIVILFINKK